ncbi:hypothetical protein OESDEN_22582 [Oesophagostomum dentatum]|uniref:Uncharacterized protein n=1 Tax=Oesophagostomum dentatum TaxID=61180 RepID=A0A0B1RXK4_OESDE|nr:hypothetical protein OESDEN_22582 [Oesophagostomum dentatum]
MKSDECKAILHPMFENFEKQYYAGHLDKSIEENFHTDGVAVHKGVGALYGKKGKHKIKSNKQQPSTS